MPPTIDKKNAAGLDAYQGGWAGSVNGSVAFEPVSGFDSSSNRTRVRSNLNHYFATDVPEAGNETFRAERTINERENSCGELRCAATAQRRE